MNRLATKSVAVMALLAGALACGSEDGGDGGQGGTSAGVAPGGAAAAGGEAGTGGSGAEAGAGGNGGSLSCEDFGDGEPNEEPADGVNLLVCTDDDPEPWPFFAGVIDGPGDVDWYHFLGTDEPGAFVDPELSFDPEDTELTLCAYFWCTDPGAWGPPEIGAGGAGGGPAHVCPPGTTEATEDLSNVDFGGQNMGPAPGCCTEAGTATFHLGEDLFTNFWVPFGCSTMTDDMKVYIRITAPHGAPAGTCEQYIVRYHF